VCVCELTTAFDLAQPTISHHLKVLREAGIIDSERRGTWVYYWLVPAALERMTALLTAPRGNCFPVPAAGTVYDIGVVAVNSVTATLLIDAGNLLAHLG
jgi:DNA-binding transcriptional ArsR family regulator